MTRMTRDSAGRDPIGFVRTENVELDAAFPIQVMDGILDDRPIRLLHRHDFLEIGVCLSGAGVYVVEDRLFGFSPGDVTIFHKFEAHYSRSVAGARSYWYWLYVDPSLLPVELVPEWSGIRRHASSFPNVVRPESDPSLAGIVGTIVDEVKQERPDHRVYVRALLAELFVRVGRLAADASAQATFDGPEADLTRIEPALEEIATAYAGDLTIEHLASLCNLSVAAFRRTFKSVMTMSPREYWTQFRLRMAASMLAGTGSTVADVYHAVGFTSQSSFNKLFLAEYGIAPGAWRRRARQQRADDRDLRVVPHYSPALVLGNDPDVWAQRVWGRAAARDRRPATGARKR
jgi:AraC-like DNA-binding protein